MDNSGCADRGRHVARRKTGIPRSWPARLNVCNLLSLSPYDFPERVFIAILRAPARAAFISRTMLAVASPLHTPNPFAATKDGQVLKLERVEFEEGAHASTLAVPEGRYQPINEMPEASTSKLPASAEPDRTSRRASVSSAATPETPAVTVPHYPTHFPRDIRKIGCGLYNNGNTCFLNSAVQCLLHTPPLLHVGLTHSERCVVHANEQFCMICAYRRIASDTFKNRSGPFNPIAITSNLFRIAKHLRKGRQEDSHEFLRFCIDAMQKSCLHGKSKAAQAKDADTTWVNQIFGGKLRSRVTCQSCGHNSDTFDTILDLSLDIDKSASVSQAVKRFVEVDKLRGADKYKCEKCKKMVNADKQFTIDSAPLVLTVHLKRFTPFGRKITGQITYGEHLSLKGAMSNGENPQYKLYGVICHAGGGPNSGHYYAFVKAPNARWYEMNDEMVSLCSQPAINLRNAYILFYIRDDGSALNDIMSGKTPDKPKENALIARPIAGRRPNAPSTPATTTTSRPALSASTSRPAERVDLGGNRSSALAALKVLKGPQPAANLSVANKGPAGPLPGMSGYDSEEDEDVGEKLSPEALVPSSPAAAKEPVSLPPSSPPPLASSSPAKPDLDDLMIKDELPKSRTPFPSGPTKRTANELGLEDSPSKRRRSSSPPLAADEDDDEADRRDRRPPPSAKRRPASIGNPFANARFGSTLHHKRDKNGIGLLDNVRPSGKSPKRRAGL
ncbi:cysteine proteinase [Auriculariales sp. MPI-PUGE-AT-0066]|nr:cysteine proteinase [Auriculariales sp. MPI-PUGE-AT-0066]